MKKSKQSNRNHLSIQINFRLPNDFKTFLYKSDKESKEDAVKACINKARELWIENEEYEPYQVKIVDQLSTKVWFEKVV